MVKIGNFPYLMSFSGQFNETVTIARNMTASSGREACGVIGGKLGQIFECIFVENIAKDGIEFLMDPVGLSNALDSLDAKGYELIALFHTHPGGPAQPSGIDIDKRSIEVPMIIISPSDIKAWRFKPDRSIEEVRLAVHNPIPRASVGPIKELRTDGLRFTIEVSGKVFEELPGILKSFFSNRNGRAFEDRMQDVQQLIQLARMGAGLRDGDDPDANVAVLLRNDNERQRDRNRPIISNVTMTGVGVSTTSTGEAIISPLDPPDPRPKAQRPAPHTHRYKHVSKDGEGRNIFECTFEGCDKSLTIDGELEGMMGETRETKIEAVAAEFRTEGDEGHGELAKGQDTAGKGADPEAGQEAGGPGGAG